MKATTIATKVVPTEGKTEYITEVENCDCGIVSWAEELQIRPKPICGEDGVMYETRCLMDCAGVKGLPGWGIGQECVKNIAVVDNRCSLACSDQVNVICANVTSQVDTIIDA